MAAPTPVEEIQWDGTRGSIRWIARFTAGNPDDFSDQQLIDIDGDLVPAANNIKIRSIDIIINGDVQVDLEYDATTDQLIDSFQGQSDVSHPFLRDYTDGPNGGFTAPTPGAAGFTGDVLLTSTNAAANDKINLFMTFQADG